MVSPAVALCVFKVYLCEGSYCLCAMGGNISVELKPPQGGKGRGRRDSDEERRGSWGVKSAMIVARGVEVAIAVDRRGRDEEAMDSWSGGDRRGGGRGSWSGGGPCWSPRTSCGTAKSAVCRLIYAKALA